MNISLHLLWLMQTRDSTQNSSFVGKYFCPKLYICKMIMLWCLALFNFLINYLPASFPHSITLVLELHEIIRNNKNTQLSFLYPHLVIHSQMCIFTLKNSSWSLCLLTSLTNTFICRSHTCDHYWVILACWTGFFLYASQLTALVFHKFSW